MGNSKKSLVNFLNHWKITGYPKNLVMNVTPGQESNFARRFLKSKLQAGRNQAPQSRPYGSKYANKHPWKNIVNSMNQYNLSNSQKNMLRRVNVAIASQPFKLWMSNRSPVNVNIKGLSRNEAIQKQKKALAAKESNQAQNTFYNARQSFNTKNENKNLAKQMYSQHREAYGN